MLFTGFPAEGPAVTDITGAQAIVITAPAAGATPQSTTAAGTGYTGAITWAPTATTFANDTAYTANVVLTADATHKFAVGATGTVVGSTSVTGNTISADAAGNTLTFAAKFANTAADPDVALVNTAKATIQGHTYTPVAQATIANAAAAKAELQRQVTALSLNGVTATVNEGTYTASVAGSASTPAGTAGKYIATVALSKGAVTGVATTAITLPITATAYVDPGATAAPAFTSTTVAKTAATQATVGFTLTAAAANTTYKVYSDSTGTVAAGYTATATGTILTLAHATDVAAGTYYIAATENGKTESAKTAITVTAYVAPVAPPVPGNPTNGTVEQPGTTTGAAFYVFNYKSTEAGTPAMGTVTLARKNGGIFDLTAVAPANTVYTMTAAAATGYKFSKWETKGRAISPTSATIEGTQAELAPYTAQFAKVDTSAPKLSQMELVTADKMSLLMGIDGNKNGFDSTVNDYKTVLMPGATGFTLNMAIQAPEADTVATVTVDGAAVTPTKSTAAGLSTYAYTKALTTTNGNVVVALTKDGKTTTYTIAVTKAAAAPQIIMDITATNNGVYDLAVSLENTSANAFAFSLKLDPTAFAGFTTNAAAELTAENALASIAAQLAANTKFDVVQAKYDPATNALIVAMASKDNAYVDCTAKTKIATLKFVTIDNQSASAENLEKLTIDKTTKSDSSLSDRNFANFIETAADGKTGLIRINLPGSVLISGYANSLMKADVQAQNIVILVHNAENAQVARFTSNADRSFAIAVGEGTYKVTITLNNYVEKIFTVTGTSDAVIGAIALVAGDIDKNGQVNAADRGELVAQLFTSVTPGAKYDIDGDGRVNAGDLGYLLANIT